MKEKKYIPRLVDKKIDEYLEICGAISIEGPKWCGKTLTSLNHSKSAVYLDDKETKDMALLEVKSLFYDEEDKIPELIDEWHLVPQIWDAVRRECDRRINKGNFILTGSTTLTKIQEKSDIHHSGTGRIAKINMYTMSLYESGDSSGKVSLRDMYEGKQKSMNTGEVEIKDLARLIIRGGWPENLNISDDKIHLIPKLYINSLLDSDINDDDTKRRDKSKMLMLLKSLARNETTVVGNQTLLRDIKETEKNSDFLSSRDTLRDYLDVLNRLHLLENQEAFSINFKSSERIGKSSKRHLTDPSLACACLDLTTDKLVKDLNTFGFMFESLVERDLRIYADYLDAHLYHFRDNVSGLEVDSILEFSDGEYAAIEIKLGYNAINDAKTSLMKFYNFVSKKPKFMCVIVGKCLSVAKDSKTGIYIVPITALKP